eukprot:15453024-Alexandrium_andersonii.AAC.1
MEEHIAKAELAEPPPPPMAESMGVEEIDVKEEPQPMTEVTSATALEAATSGVAPPPRAEAFPDAPVAAKLPFASFPGLKDTSNPVMAACHGAWNELVEM